MGGPRQWGWAPVGLRSCFLCGLLSRMGGPRRRGWVFVGLPSCFLFRLLGRMGGPQPRSCSHWAPFILPFWAAGSDGWAAPTSWAPIDLPSCFLSGSWVGWVGRGKEAGLPLSSLQISFLGCWVGSLHVSFFLGSWVGWVGRGQEAGLALGSLPFAFLGSWVGWVGRGQEAGPC